MAISETLIASPIIKYLEFHDWDVYQEVKFIRGSRVADIAAVKYGQLWIIEVKNSLTLAVMEQAHGWRCHYRSCAVPATKRRRKSDLPFRIAKDFLSIGVIEISKYNKVIEKVKAPYMEKYDNFSSRLIPQLLPEHKTFAVAGSAKGGYYTSYKGTIGKVKEYIIKNPGCSMKEILKSVGKGHYKTLSSASNSLKTALDKWESKWCRSEITGSGERIYFYKVNKE